MALYEGGGRFLDHPGDVRIRKMISNGVQGGKGVDDISDGAQFNDQDVHVPRCSRAISKTLSTVTAVMHR